MPPKKSTFNPFKTRSRARSVDGPAVLPEDATQQLGQFHESVVTFAPCIPKTEVSLTLKFRCSVKLVRGDTVTFRLAGFKGNAPGVFTLESRPHPEGNLFFHTHFHAYWSGESAIKGGPPAQTITLLVRQPIDENTLVIVGVPESVHIILPDKLAANSAKLKIDAVAKYASGGKIPKAPVLECPEIAKKRAIDDDVNELHNAVRDCAATAQLTEDEGQFAFDMGIHETDQIWEGTRDLSDLKIGLRYSLEPSVFKDFGEHAKLAKCVVDNYMAAYKKRIPLALHKELAANLGVKVGEIIMLEDALYTQHGCFYNELSRAAVMVLRLYTCEPGDLMRMLGLNSAPCIYREVFSAIRMCDEPLLAKWTQFIAVLSSCSRSLNFVAEHVPVLYKGVKDLPQESLQYLETLKPESWYVFPNFTTCVVDVPFQDEAYSAPSNAVLFEIHGATEGVEISDVAQFPEDREWILPMFSSFDVVSVDVLTEKNNMLHVVLRMTGSLAGLRVDKFPDEYRTAMSNAMKKVKADCGMMAEKSMWLAKMVYANIKLNAAKYLHPQHVVQQQYLERFAEVKRASIAKQAIEENIVRWQQCTVEATTTADGIVRPAQWDTIANKVKQAIPLETAFLKRTRQTKQFVLEGVTVDFKEWTVDLGKGVKHVRRLVGKVVTHPYQP